MDLSVINTSHKTAYLSLRWHKRVNETKRQWFLAFFWQAESCSLMRFFKWMGKWKRRNGFFGECADFRWIDNRSIMLKCIHANLLQWGKQKMTKIITNKFNNENRPQLISHSFCESVNYIICCYFDGIKLCWLFAVSLESRLTDWEKRMSERFESIFIYVNFSIVIV